MKVVKLQKFDQSGKIAVNVNHRYEFVEMNRILYCEADGCYSFIHLTDKTTFMNSQTLKCVLEELKEFGFFAVDKSLVVNLMFIRSITQDRNATIVLENDTELKISRDQKTKLLNLLFGNDAPN